MRKLAKEADEVVIATDFDREGELIGLEALQQALDANPKIIEAIAASADVAGGLYASSGPRSSAPATRR